ncbi:beta strand repeat-containing protein [Solitalea lacus]|uniref:beta strand repeat-containing protein n=1 Tax=Solitalea lacus TaxID=2911172 RepID=UPI001EDA9E30|nr:hypothetical protein [Solitalea lacus]UKJ07564.1 hypothetical protein L2B55_00020 [Solitalea lacus]
MLLILIFFSLSINSYAQNAGDFRSTASGGAWNVSSSWETYNGTSWVAASTYPGASSGSYAVEIVAGSTVTISTTISTQPMGTVTVKGTLELIGTSSSQVNIGINTQNLIVTPSLSPYATIKFTDKVKLSLPNNAVIRVSTGGLTGDCNNNEDIYIGGTSYAVCAGGNSDYTFAELMTQGGTIKAEPTLKNPVCEGGIIELLGNYSGYVEATPTYSWTITNPNNVVTTSNQQNPPSISPAIAGTYSAILKASVGTGSNAYENTQTLTFTVTAKPTVNAGGPNTVCQSATPSAITLSGASIGGGATTGAWSITSGGGTLSSSAQTGTPATETYTPAANFSGTVTLTLTTNAPGACSAVSATRTIIVTPINTAGPASSSPTVCISTAMTNITHTTTGATGIGAATGLPSGVTASWAANTITISGTPTASGPFSYTIPLTGGCGSASATGTITVTPANTVSAASSSPTVCISTAMTNITHTTTGATGIGAATGLPSGVTASWAANTITISGTPTVSGPFSYTIPLTGGCGSASATGTITVTPANTVSAASSSPTVCISTAMTNITHTTTGATGIGAATGLPSGVTASWAANTITISGTPSASGPFSYTIPLTGGCGSVNATGTITVNPTPTVTLGTNPSICLGVTSANLTYSATTGLSDQYSIDFDAAANAAGFADINNQTLPVSSISIAVAATAAAGTYNGQLTVRNSVTGCVSISYPIAVSIYAPIVFTTAFTNVKCKGGSAGTITATVTSGGSGEYEFILKSGATIVQNVSPGASVSNYQFTGVGKGVYTITIRDINTGCSTVCQ